MSVLNLKNTETGQWEKVTCLRGTPGKDGVSVTNATVNSNGQLVVTLSNNTSITAGKVTGNDGIGITNVEINTDGCLVLTYSNGASTTLDKVVGDGSGNTTPEVYVGAEAPSSGEVIWINPDEDVISSQEVIKQAIAAYMLENPVVETDPTVPDWAKQPNKPKYTAVEVGALPADTPLPSGGDSLEFIKSITLTEDVSSIKINTDADENPLNLKRIILVVKTIGGANNTGKGIYQVYPGSVNAGAIRFGLADGVYASGNPVASVVDIQVVTSGTFLAQTSVNGTIRQTWGKYQNDDTIREVNAYVSTDGHTFGTGSVFYVMGVRV